MKTRFAKFLTTLALGLGLVACGGGGGSAGSSSGSSSSSSSSSGKPSITLSLVDGSGATISTNSVSGSSATYAKAVVKDATGTVVTNKLVTFTAGTSGYVTFTPAGGQVLTDSSGIAKVQLAPASVTSVGALSLSVASTVSSTAVTTSIDIQTLATNVTLQNMTAGSSSLAAYGVTGISVDVYANGVLSTAGNVIVNFSTNCGTLSSSSVTTNSLGKASTSFNSSGCAGGNAVVTASATGASTSLSTTIAVAAPATTNLKFVSASPSTIYTSVAAFGVKSSLVTFQLVDNNGNAITSQPNVTLTLDAASTSAGVTWDDGTVSAKTVTADASGFAQARIQSGAVPTPVTVNASFSTLTAASAGLAVNSGRPTQNSFSMSASMYNIEGWSYDGTSTTIQVYLADRLAQPVPAGTVVTFVSEGGQITGSCTVVIDSNNKSGCNVTLISQAFRPSNGVVTVLAYAQGEKTFVDLNGNNKYDSGETFYDQGQVFLDKDENGTYDSGTDQLIGASGAGPGVGTATCLQQPSGAANPYLVANVGSSCDGAWGSTLVRGSIRIIFSGSTATPSVTGTPSGTGFVFTIQDLHGNPMPGGTTVSASVSGATGAGCAVTSVTPSTLSGAEPGPTSHVVLLNNTGCSGQTVSVLVTTPKGQQTAFTQTIP